MRLFFCCLVTIASATVAQADPLSSVLKPSGFLDTSTGAFGRVNDFLDFHKKFTDAFDDVTAPQPEPEYDEFSLNPECIDDPQCAACTEGDDARVERAFEVLINNEQLLARTLKKAKLYGIAAEGAAAQHPAAKAAYAIQQARDIEPAKKDFMKKLGNAQNDALDYMYDTMMHIAECEQEHLGTNAYYGYAENAYGVAKLRFALTLKGAAQ